VIALGTRAKNRPERDRVVEGISRDIEKVIKDIYKAEETDLKKLHEEKREVYTDRLVKLKVKANKQKAKLEQVKSGATLAPSSGLLTEPLIQDGDDVELMDLEKADKQLVGDAGLMLQARTKDALGRIIAKQEQMNQIAPEMLLELQK
jgi:hypothetical protein